MRYTRSISYSLRRRCPIRQAEIVGHFLVLNGHFLRLKDIPCNLTGGIIISLYEAM
jgi:hypothetical protein